MKLKKRRHNNLIFTILMVFIFTWGNINYIGSKLIIYVQNIVEKNVNRDIYNYVFYIFDQETLENEELLDIVELNMNSEGEVVSVNYNFNIAYKYLSDGMDKLYNNVYDLKINTDYDEIKDGIYFLPVGLTQNNMISNNFGFKIPCKINYLSDVDMGFKTKVTDYGMNNLLIELLLSIDIKNNLLISSNFYEFGNSYEMIIASKVVMGKIPEYLGNTIEKSSSIVSS